jgi:hypothetical protein
MVETQSDGCSKGSVPGNRDRIWLRHKAMVVAWGVSLVIETGYG